MSQLVRRSTPPLSLGAVVAALMIVAETLVLYPLEQLAPENALVVVYLLGVVVVAIGWGLWLAVVTAVISAMTYDYFHTAPLYSLTMARAEDWVAMVSLVVTAVVTAAVAGTLGALARSRGAEADQRRREAQVSRDELGVLAMQQSALRRVATLVADGAAPSEVFATVAEEMRRCLDAMTAGLYRFETGAEVTLVAASAEPGLPDAPVGDRMPIEGDNLAAMVLHSGGPARQDSLENAAGPIAERVRGLGIRAAVGAPIIVDGRLWGLAAVGSAEPGSLPPDTEERVGDFADLVATALANAATRAELIASRARIVAAADNARRHIERDLHDGAQQRLVSWGLKLRLAEAAVQPEQIDLKKELADMVSDLTDLLAELQELSRGIHPAILSEGGLGPALKTLVRRSTVPVSLDVAINQRLPDSVEVAAYYVVAEALTNAAKHAQARRVTVSAEAADYKLDLSICDDGIGGADAGNGSGLIGLKDRIEALGGHMQVTSPRGGGTSLQATIPLASE
jgi:signal transduction histidine kinase